MPHVLMITSGAVDPARADAFQVAFHALFAERLPKATYVRETILVHHGQGRWSVLTLTDDERALRTRPPHAVPTPVQLFRDFGVEPTVEVAEVAAVFTQAPSQTPTAKPK